jgi:type IV pilus assembly protein PilW
MNRQTVLPGRFITDRQGSSGAVFRSDLAKAPGFGLIELMISMVIASLMILGLVTLVGNMQTTYATQSDSVGVSDKERFAGSLLGNSIETAGYYTVPNPVTFVLPNPIVTWLPASSSGGATYVAGQVVAGTTGASATTPDTLNVRFQTGYPDSSNNSNCLGGTPPQVSGTSVIFESVYSVNTTNNTLQCTVYTTTTTATGTTNTVTGPTILIDGVSNMKVLYGVDVSGSSTTGSVTEYFSATNMPSANWINLRSVQVALTFVATNNLTTTANGTGAMTTSNAAAQVYSQTFQVMYAVP